MHEMKRIDGAQILVVSPTPTWPLDHGNRKRVFSVCQALKERGAVIHFLYYPSEGDWRNHFPKDALKRMQAQWDYVYKVAPDKALHMKPKGDDHTIDEWWDDAVENEVKWLMERNRFDALIVNYSWLAKALTFASKSCLRVLDTHDRFSNRGDLLLENRIKKEFFHTTQHQEFMALERADLVWAIKPEEEAFFNELLDAFEHEEEEKPKHLALLALEEEEEADDYDYDNTVVKTLLHVEEKPGFEFRAACEANGYLTVGIVGAYNNINLVNTREFLDTALPIFEKHMAPVRVVLAGSMCKGLQDIDHPFVELIGRVESLDDFYAQLDIALVPMTFSTGLKIKAGEALAYGVPLIAHAHAYEGYPVCHDWQALESMEAVAEAVVEAAFEPGIIRELKRASDEAQAALRARVGETLDHFVETLKAHRPSALIVLPKIEGGDYSLYKLKISEIIKTFDEAYRPVFYYPHALSDDSLVYLHRLENYGLVATRDEERAFGPLGGIGLEALHETWAFELVWNLTDEHVSREVLGSDVDYFHDVSFACAGNDAVPAACDVEVRSATLETSAPGKHLPWYASPVTGRIEELYVDMWGEKPAQECRNVYVLLSGSREQMRFWYRVYEALLSNRYRLHWIVDADESDWPAEGMTHALDVAKDFSRLRAPARCAMMANLGRSNLLASIAWTLFVCKRRVYDAEELPIDAKGFVTLSTAFEEINRSADDLDLNSYNNRFQHNAAMKFEFAEAYKRIRSRKVPLCLKQPS